MIPEDTESADDTDSSDDPLRCLSKITCNFFINVPT